MMLSFNYWCLFAIIAIQNVTALKCRPENQQMDMQYEKVLEICKRRNSVLGSKDLNSGSTETSSSEDKSNFEEDIFSKKFLANNQDTRSYMNNQRDRNGQNRMNNSYSNNRGNNDNRWNDERNMRGLNNHQQHSNTYSRTYNNRNNVHLDKVGNKNNFNRDQGCVFQCFFNEFNAVDHKGFPVKDSVIRLMIQDIQDIDLQDFIQESVEECYRYLQPFIVKDNCEFSLNLLNCLTDKAKEGCDDWIE